jgi:hypothetical protein
LSPSVPHGTLPCIDARAHEMPFKFSVGLACIVFHKVACKSQGHLLPQ